MKILLLIRNLEVGGAERQLVILANGLIDSGHQVSIGLFYMTGDLLDELDASIDVLDLGKKGRYDFVGFFYRFVMTLKQANFDVLICSLPAACITGLLSYLSFSRPILMWRVAVSWMNLDDYNLLDRLSYRLQSGLSGMADWIVFNSEAGFSLASKLGYKTSNAEVVYNGIDTIRFHKRPVRKKHVIPYVGIVGRIDPVKNHKLFLDAASILVKEQVSVRFIIAGPGNDEQVAWLHECINTRGLADYVDYRPNEDIVNIYQMLSVCVLTSISEGFPNVLAEAMACGTPCVSTRVGDASKIISEFGCIVDSSDARDVANSIRHIINLSDHEYLSLSSGGREHICHNFSSKMALDCWNTLLSESTR